MFAAMLRSLPAGFIAPCLPTKADTLPSGEMWLHEIKHDGFRIIARKDGERVRLYSRPGNDMTRRFPLIAEALARLRSRSCIIDGEAVACNDNGVASFERIRYRQHDGNVFLYAFHLIELNGDDLRRDPLQVRKATLASIVAKARPGIRFNEHIEGDGPTVFAHACKVGLEGIVSKRKDSAYRSGRSADWLKMNNPEASAVKREAEEDRADEIATDTGFYSGCAHATDGKPARHAQSSYATHPWVATPIAPISADATTITTPTFCQRVSVGQKYLTSIGLPSQ
jgi:bifunctional non-homologous end joining protein LigD